MTPQEQPDSQAGDEVDAIFDGLFKVPKSPTEMKAAVRSYAERLAAEWAKMERIVETDCTIKILQEMKAPKHIIKEFQEKYDELTATLTKETKQ